MSRLSKRFCASVFALFCVSLTAQSTRSNLPIAFEKNQGQLPPQYDFHFYRDGIDTVFSRDGAAFSWAGSAGVVRLSFAGAKAAAPQGSGLQSGRANYFLGKDSSRWFRDIQLYSAIEYRDLYPGISVRFYGNGEELEHDFMVQPGADPDEIAIQAKGTSGIAELPDGGLRLHSGSGSFVLRKPVAYQVGDSGKHYVTARFQVDGDTIRLKVADYDRSRELVIDPVYVFSTYLGGTGSDAAAAVTTDASGNILITGRTSSADFPTQSSLYPKNQGADVFVTKLDPTGKTLIYSTYLGGARDDYGAAIATDKAGNAIVGGISVSGDFPAAGAIASANCQINQNCYFLASISPDGSKLNYSGLVGGSEGNYSNGEDGQVAVDGSGNAYLAGVTGDRNFQITPGTLTASGPALYQSNMFVLKVDPTGKLIYSTLVPGNAPDDPTQVYNNEFLPTGLSVDAAGNVTAAGWAGLGLPTTAGVVGASFPNPSVNVSSPRAGFVLQLNATASALNYASYLPGTDVAGGLAVDAKGNLWVAGTTGETTLPVSANAYQKAPSVARSSGPLSGYIMEIGPGATSVLAATYLDGPGTGQNFESSAFNAIVLDGKGTVYVGGTTSSPDFPMLDPFVTAYEYTGSIWDMILAGMSSDLSTVTFGSFFNATDVPFAGSRFGDLTLDPNGNLIVVGSTNSRNFPTTSGSFEPQLPPPVSPMSAPGHAFVAKFDMGTPAPSVCFDQLSLDFGNVNALATVSKTIQVTNCGNATLHITAATSSDATLTADQSCGSVASGSSCPITLKFTPVSSNRTSGTVTLTDDAATLPQSVSFTGQGIAPKISVNQNPLDFGHLVVGTSGPDVVLYIANQGQVPLTISKVTASGSSFSIHSEDCTTAGPPWGCIVQLVFSPKATGALSGSLTIASNDPATPQLVVALTGTGDASYDLPVLNSIGTPAVPINAGDQTITITGSNFYPASVAQINAFSLKTTFVDNATLHVTVPATSLTGLGEMQVTVVNPSPGGGASNSLLLTPFAALPLNASAAVYVPTAGKVFASISASSSTNANTVIPVDPATATAGTPIPVGKDPRFITASSDGAYLFVANEGDQTVQRINLKTSTVDRTFPYGPNTFCSSCNLGLAADLHSVPGSPAEVVLSQGFNITLYNDSGIVNTVPGAFVSYNAPTFDNFAIAGSPLAIYAMPFTSVQNPFFNYAQITSSGLVYTEFRGTNYGQPNNGNQVVTDGTLLYTNAGEIWDPATKSKVGSFAVDRSGLHSITVDSAEEEIFAVGSENYQNSFQVVLSAFSTKTGLRTGTVPFIQTYWPNQSSLTRWGKDGFAFIGAGAGLTDNELYLLRSSIAGPQTSNPLPVLTAVSPNSATAGGAAFTLTISGTNFVNGSQVKWNGAPLATAFVDAQTLTAEVPSANIATAETAHVEVYSPGPGGGSSAVVDFVIAPAVGAELSTTSLDFGNQAQGVASAVHTVKLTNRGSASLNIAGITASGDFSQTNTCGTALPGGGACSISVTFTPTAAGVRSGTLSVADDASGSPQTVSLTGIGVAALTIGTQQGGSTSSTVKSGNPATYNLALTGAPGFNGTVTLTCSGAPQYANCSLSPSSLTLSSGSNATFTATVTTTRQVASAGRRLDRPAMVLCLIPLLVLPWTRRKKFSILRTGLVLAFLAINIGFIGCGGGKSTGGSTGATTANTPPGTYTLTVTASAGATSVTQNLTLTVQ